MVFKIRITIAAQNNCEKITYLKGNLCDGLSNKIGSKKILLLLGSITPYRYFNQTEIIYY